MTIRHFGWAALLSLIAAGQISAQTTQPLAVGKTIDRALAPGQAHSYTLAIDSGRFLTGRAVQQGIDVRVALVGPKGDTLGRFDSPNGDQGAEPFQLTTTAKGTYRIVVAPLGENDKSGRYTLTVERVVAAATTPSGRVDQMMTAIDPAGPGVAVAVVQNGRTIYEKAWGLANLTHKVPFTVNTRNNIGSTSKQFTAFAILLLAQQGKLSLDDDVRTHIPELPDLGQKVTIRNLLTHTSGYREFLNALALTGRRLDFGDYIDRNEIIELIKRQPALQNTPGAEFNYNNTGYALASMIVERVSGQSFPEFLQQHVFQPAGMTHTVVRASPGQIVPNSAQGYLTVPGGYREAQDLGASMGAGGIYSTVGDLAKWLRNYKTQTVGPRGFFEQMSTRDILTKGDTSGYGLGLMISTWRDQLRVQHGGADVAHRSALIYFPALDAGITVQSNSPTINPDMYAARILEAFFPPLKAPEPGAKPAGAPGAFAFDTARFDNFAGRYAIDAAPEVVISFTRRGDRYFTQVTGQPEVEMLPTSDTTFKLTIVDAIVAFHPVPDGRVSRITLHQNGTHGATRVPETAAPIKLADYTGRYYSAELEAFYDVVLTNDSLSLRSRRLEPIPLKHMREDRFSGTFPVANVEFQRDAAGRVTGFRAGNGRTRDVLFTRMD